MAKMEQNTEIKCFNNIENYLFKISLTQKSLWKLIFSHLKFSTLTNLNLLTKNIFLNFPNSFS